MARALPARASQAEVLERYESHVKHCAACSGALANIRRTHRFAEVAVVIGPRRRSSTRAPRAWWWRRSASRQRACAPCSTPRCASACTRRLAMRRAPLYSACRPSTGPTSYPSEPTAPFDRGGRAIPRRERERHVLPSCPVLHPHVPSRTCPLFPLNTFVGHGKRAQLRAAGVSH